MLIANAAADAISSALALQGGFSRVVSFDSCGTAPSSFIPLPRRLLG